MILGMILGMGLKPEWFWVWFWEWVWEWVSSLSGRMRPPCWRRRVSVILLVPLIITFSLLVIFGFGYRISFVVGV